MSIPIWVFWLLSSAVGLGLIVGLVNLVLLTAMARVVMLIYKKERE